MKFGKALTLEQFRDIMRTISQEHRFGFNFENNSKHLKYVEPIYDMRTMDIFVITFRGMGKEMRFDFRDSEVDMYERIMEWLGGNVIDSEK